MGAPRRAPGDGLTLRDRAGTTFRFDPGALCLELLLTGGPGWLARFEVLHEPADLIRWAALSRLPGGLDLPVTEDDLPAARALRDALHGIAADRVNGRQPDQAAYRVVNAAAAHAPLAVCFTPGGERGWAPGATAPHLLSTVARDAVELFTGPHAERVRECATDNCSLLFVDTSRPGRRRWCAMERCGNRHKVRAHRARQTPPAPR
ncbi:CGNR zinc finger domain-containing protein [Streptomyces sp. NPDC127068]|uniref:CGNR zinc finger domain-containing protein n=1 Tax=Streptomyces sp. NPDC127068 TaxID=3347127 RepID=UPI00364CE729